MRVTFRVATRDDVAAIIDLFRDDYLGQGRENPDDMAAYLIAFDGIENEPNNDIIVGEDEDGTIVATYQLTCIAGLALAATRRAQVEGVRVASHLRGQGIGEAMFQDVEARARAAGCGLVQLTMNQTRKDAHRFYERIGFVASHTGFKRPLD